MDWVALVLVGSTLLWMAAACGECTRLVRFRRSVVLIGKMLPRRWLVFAVILAALGCSRSDNSHINLAPPVQSTTLGPGDVFHMEIVGEKDLPQDYQVASDGSVDLPFLHTLNVKDLEPQQVARLIRERLIQGKILSDPSVIVSVKEYHSKRITVLGQVQKPGSFPLSPGLTIIQAISLAGGFNSIANKDRVNLTRKGKAGTKTVVLSVDAITEGRSLDIPLQAGDQIYVHERVF
jgi:protein involved in polysaccharide export with SLBB domain